MKKKEKAIEEFNDIDNEKLLHEEYENEITSNQPLLELFTAKNVKFKTQVTEEQRNTLSILMMSYKRCVEKHISFETLKNVLDEFIDFGVPMDRKSRLEFVESHKALNLQKQNDKNNLNDNDLSNLKA